MTGSLVGSSDLNTDIRDNMNYLLGGRAASAWATKVGSATTTSGSWADIDAVNLSVSITIVGSVIMALLQAEFRHQIPSSAADLKWDLACDGVRSGHGWGLNVNTGNTWTSGSFMVIFTGLTAGVHTIKAQWQGNPSSTGYLNPAGGNPAYLYAREIG